VPTDDLVIPVRVPREYRWLWPIVSVAVVVGAAVLLAFDRSVAAIVAAVLLIGSIAWIWATNLDGRRARGNAPNQLVLSADGIRSPVFSLPWEGINRVWIGTTSAGGLRALFIAPVRSSDVRWSSSKMIRANRWLTERLDQTPIQLLQVHMDIPLERLVAEMEKRAGRKLG
jgi:hypothetical protein